MLRLVQPTGCAVTYTLSLGRRLSLVFFGLFATFLVLGLAGAWSLSESNAVSTDVRDHWLPNVRLLGDLNNFTSDYRTAEANCLLAVNGEEFAASRHEIEQLGQAVAKAQQDYEQLPHGLEEAALYKEFSVTWARYKSVADQVTTLSAAGRGVEAAAVYRSRSRIIYDTASDLLGRLTDNNVALAARASKRSAAAYERARWIMGTALAFSGLMLFVVVVQVRRQIAVPLRDLSQAMRKLVANDTSAGIHHTSRTDEIGEMARAVVVFRANAVELTHSQRGLAQQATMLAEKLAHEQSVTQMQRNFVSMITHEFRTPLTQIDAHAQRLVSLKDRLEPPEICGRAGRIRAAVARIVRLIDQLVDATRVLDADANLFFHPEALDLVTVLREVCRVHREISPGVQIMEYYDQMRLSMQGDPKLLFQAFSNLLSNAIKYSPANGKVTLRTQLLDGQIAVSVEDAGIGIPAQDLANVFDRYYRGGNVSGFVGTGVGLFLVATVIRLHNGTINVDSIEGRGSRFTVTLAEQTPSQPASR
jgi:two-component system, OmpR family, sensor kinase